MATQIHPEIMPPLPAVRLQAQPVGPEPTPVKTKKKLIRRSEHEYSQVLRRSFQVAFLLLNAWVGTLFYTWMRQFEPGGQATAVARPAGVEGWLPIAGLMNLRYFALTHTVPTIHPAAMFLLVTFLAMAFLLRKAFCSWLCPVGTISEYLWQLGRRLFKHNFRLPRWLDIGLRGLKYFLLGFFAWAVSTMAAPEISSFLRSPYGLIADVKMLNFFRHIGETGLIVLGVLMVASVLVQNFWCRYLCPYGALLGLAALFSPLRIRRNASACIDCAKCAKACPSSLPVDQLVTIKSVECTGCMECVAVCPAQGALQMSLLKLMPTARPRTMPAWAMAAGIAVLFTGIVGFAKTAGYWNSTVPDATYRELVPHADEARHPMPGQQ